MQNLTIDLTTASLTQVIDRFSMALEAEIHRLDAEEGLTLSAPVVTKVLTTLEVLSDMTMAHHA